MSLPADDVAEDFRDALQDLKVNSRPEISNLTIIAKENTEHAQAISRELENHIRHTRPDTKLPALYVLDSIVKNIGTPYTVYLSRNLYKTFMDAYTVVDPGTRKAMESLLKTWKAPVPESIETRPVFPAEATRDIESALIKFRTATLQHQQQRAPQRPMVGPYVGRPQHVPPYRNTPTPPQVGRYPSPKAAGSFPPPANDPRVRSSTPQQYSHFGTPNGSLTPQSLAALLSNPPPATPVNDMNKLLDDVENLIGQSKETFARNPYDQAIQQKLKALLDLQSLLKTQQLPPASLQAVKDQVAALSRTIQPPAPAPPPVVPVSTPTPMQMPQAPTPQNNHAPPPQLPPNILAILGQNAAISTPPVQPPSAPPAPPPRAPPSNPINLAALLAAQTPPVPQPSSTPAPGGNSLLDALRSAGLVSASSTPQPKPSSQTTPVPSAPPGSHLTAVNDVQMNNSSIKQPRPHLISLLYEARPNRCHACGRRFPATEEGRERKQRHLDWHYSVKTRIAEGKRGAVNRDWYINELEWIGYREQDEASAPDEAESVERKEPDEQFVRVPADAAMQKVTCPICQDPFQPSWRDDEWVWMDALEAGGRIYHASCYKEATKDSINLPSRQRSPPVLGKRKAGVEDEAYFKSKIKRDGTI